MTNEQLFDDLKQFILATVSQATADMATKADIAELKSQINDIDLKVSTIAEAHSEVIEDHETRLLKLESLKTS